MQIETKPKPFVGDQVVGVLVVTASACLGLINFVLIQGLKGQVNLGGERPQLSDSATKFIQEMPLWPIALVFALHVAAGIGVFLGRKWGFWLALVFMLASLAGSSGLGLAIALGVIIYSGLRLAKVVGPQPT